MKFVSNILLIGREVKYVFKKLLMMTSGMMLNKITNFGLKLCNLRFGGDDEILASIFGCWVSSSNLLKYNYSGSRCTKLLHLGTEPKYNF
jgi:hypothetical protein